MGSCTEGGKQIAKFNYCKGFDLVFALTIIPSNRTTYAETSLTN